MKRNTWIFLGVGVAAVAGGAYYFLAKPKDEVKWRLSKLEKGNITQRISATGAVAPMVQVAVGTQVSGVIQALYADYNSIVKKGQIIAQIDPTVWQTQLRDAEASLERAKANVEDAKRQLDRAKRLFAEKLLADQDLDAKDTAYKSAAASHENAKAALERAKANLEYCNISAPVDGVVISRLADVGQTVAASFSTPNLFQIAQDLSKMKVEISIDEADIDEVKVGQRAMFTVDSLPEKQFMATVSQVRLEPITTQNVVTYKVVIEVPNEPLPGTEGASDKPAEPGQAKGPERGEGAHRRKQETPAATQARPGGGQPGGFGSGDFNPDRMWEMNKDRILERNPGTTKEEWLKRMKERMSQGQGGGREGRPSFGGRPGGAPPAPAAPPAQLPANEAARLEVARTPGGAARLGGPVFSGNLALRPGMTANVTIITNRKQDVLRVPNAALRFNPTAFIKDETKKDAPKAGGLGQPMGMGMFGGGQRPAGQGGGASTKGMAMRREDRIWILENGKPKAITLKAGITDGQFTEVTGENLQEGMQILLGVENLRAGGPTVAPVGGMPGGGGGGGGRR